MEVQAPCARASSLPHPKGPELLLCFPFITGGAGSCILSRVTPTCAHPSALLVFFSSLP